MAIRYLASNAPSHKPSDAPGPLGRGQAHFAHALGGRRTRPSPTPHLTRGQYLILLAVIEDGGGLVTLDRIARAMPQVSQPVSAVLDLCDAGILGADLAAAFDGDMPVWRTGR